MTDDPRSQPAVLSVEQMDRLLTRLDALDILVQRLIHIVGQLGPGAFEFLVSPPNREVPPAQRVYNERVTKIIVEIVSAERDKVLAQKAAAEAAKR